MSHTKGHEFEKKSKEMEKGTSESNSNECEEPAVEDSQSVNTSLTTLVPLD